MNSDKPYTNLQSYVVFLPLPPLFPLLPVPAKTNIYERNSVLAGDWMGVRWRNRRRRRSLGEFDYNP
ncbi:hypothetical protein [Nostoc sp.]|uniref:hypothetical protein n=1 Tax=Nostoc sp. TaxID=1180 RepID=UPI002FF7AEAE